MANKEYFTIATGKQMVIDIVIKLKADGFAIDVSNFNIIDFKDIGRTIGNFWLEDTYKYNLVFNTKLLQKEKIDFLNCAIYHELAHAIQYTEAFNAKIIAYDKQSDEVYSITNNQNLAINTIFDNFGHTLLWENIIKKFNNYYKITPPITDYLSEEQLDQFLEAIFMDQLRRKSMHIDKTISGLTIDDMMKYNVKPEYHKITVNESYEVKHDYRDLKQYDK